MLEIIFIIKFFIALFILATSFLAYGLKNLRAQKNDKTVFIVVLGDVERSPRMKYHCLSLVKLGYAVKFIGYVETKIMSQIATNKAISIVGLKCFPKYLQVGPRLIQYAAKTLFLSLNLAVILLKQRPVPRFVLVQNPPSIPTLGLVYFYCSLVDSKFIIDWHNYGYTILSLASGPESILVKICRKFEFYFGAKSDFNICVTSAMSKDLRSHNINSTVMYDKAYEHFGSLNITDKHKFYLKLINSYKLESLKISENQTIFTQAVGNSIEESQNRPAILVSSSSWTEDEDFNLLIDAFDAYQKKILSDGKLLPKIICFLTGKGPLKDFYKQKFKSKNFKNIEVHFLWLESEDYPLLLGSADLGISLHKSSSNLDLPMKVVDMFGAKLPVCALYFSCIDELVKTNENGLLFQTSEDLSQHFFNVLPEIQKRNSKLLQMKENLSSFSNWEEEWNKKFKPILENS